MTKWQNDKMTKWQNDKMTKWEPFIFAKNNDFFTFSFLIAQNLRFREFYFILLSFVKWQMTNDKWQMTNDEGKSYLLHWIFDQR